MTKRKRRRSWGSITTVNKNKHILRWTENSPEGRTRKSHTFYGTYREAILELDKKHVEHAHDVLSPTIGKIYKTLYLPQLEQRLKAGTLAKSSYNAFVHAYEHDMAPTWDKILVTEVKPAKVQEWLLTLTYSIAQINVIVFKTILDIAMNYEMVDVNVLRRKYIMPAKANKHAKTVFTIDEAMDMLDRVHGQLFEAAYITSTFGGARLGESLAVSKPDIRTMESDGQAFVVVSINKQIIQGSKLVTTRMKTEQSLRETLVPMKYGGQRLLEIVDSADSLWLNDNLSGEPLEQKKLTSLWKALTKDDFIPFRNLRNSWRTFAQYVWGVDYDTLELLMGHKLQGITGAHYLRPSINDLAHNFALALNRVESS